MYISRACNCLANVEVYDSRISVLSCLSCGSNQLEGQITCVARKTGIVLAVSIRVCECVCVSISLFACLLKTEKNYQKLI